jgi:hypothetical protein
MLEIGMTRSLLYLPTESHLVLTTLGERIGVSLYPIFIPGHMCFLVQNQNISFSCDHWNERARSIQASERRLFIQSIIGIFLKLWGEPGLKTNVPISPSNCDIMYIPFYPQLG